MSRPRRRSTKPTGPDFWGQNSSIIDEPAPRVRPSPQPDAVVRSLGAPPLPGHETAAEHYFAVVYGKAVGLAGALAAAGGLLEPAPEDEEHQVN
jgi:hypothetical protein